MERSSVFMDWKNDIVKPDLLLKMTNRLHANLIKTPMTFFTELAKTIPKVIWKNERARIAKTIMSKISNAGGITISAFKRFFRAIPKQTAQYCH